MSSRVTGDGLKAIAEWKSIYFKTHMSISSALHRQATNLIQTFHVTISKLRVMANYFATNPVQRAKFPWKSWFRNLDDEALFVFLRFYILKTLHWYFCHFRLITHWMWAAILVMQGTPLHTPTTADSPHLTEITIIGEKTVLSPLRVHGGLCVVFLVPSNAISLQIVTW